MMKFAAIVAAAITVAVSLPPPAHAVTQDITACTQIRTAAQLQAMNNNLAGVYCLMNDIDAGSVANFTPVGGEGGAFRGRFFGNGHVIRNLKIDHTFVAGLFGATIDAVIQDVGIVNVDVTARAGSGAAFAGGLAGAVQQDGGPATVERVFVTGKVRCLGGCVGGGLIGAAFTRSVSDSWSSALVTSDFAAGGLIGESAASSIQSSYATGDVTCAASSCRVAGGLIGFTGTAENVADSFATGRVTCSASNCIVGGLVGLNNETSLTNTYATGAVTSDGPGGSVGGLIGSQGGGSIVSSFAAGRVTVGNGVFVGGLIGQDSGQSTVTNSFWDEQTTHHAGSANNLGLGLSSAELKSALPAGFGTGAWGITKGRSYPFLAIDGFSSNLATVTLPGEVFTALPIVQSDKSQYLGNPRHADQASLAVVYTMVARAIGTSNGQRAQAHVSVDKPFWNDTTQTAAFRGPVTSFVALGPTKSIAEHGKLDRSNAIAAFDHGNWVVLRGHFSKPGGSKATHFMLGTLYTRKGANVSLVIANDPFTGQQVAIDPLTKKVVLPQGFPLTGFTVDGFAELRFLVPSLAAR